MILLLLEMVGKFGKDALVGDDNDDDGHGDANEPEFEDIDSSSMPANSERKLRTGVTVEMTLIG